MELWDAIGRFEDSQTQILTTAMLLIGGGLGVWLSSLLFGGRVSNLQGAVKETEKAVADFKTTTFEQLENLQKQLDSTMEQLTRARKEITDLAPPEPEEAAAPGPSTGTAPAHGNGLRAEFLRYWYAIRDRLRSQSQSMKVHGHRRAKYSKYSNNQIGVLIDDMRHDGELDETMAKNYHEAHDLFAWHRNGRPPLSRDDVTQMQLLAVRVGAI